MANKTTGTDPSIHMVVQAHDNLRVELRDLRKTKAERRKAEEEAREIEAAANAKDDQAEGDACLRYGKTVLDIVNGVVEERDAEAAGKKEAVEEVNHLKVKLEGVQRELVTAKQQAENTKTKLAQEKAKSDRLQLQADEVPDLQEELAEVTNQLSGSKRNAEAKKQLLQLEQQAKNDAIKERDEALEKCKKLQQELVDVTEKFKQSLLQMSPEGKAPSASNPESKEHPMPGLQLDTLLTTTSTESESVDSKKAASVDDEENTGNGEQ